MGKGVEAPAHLPALHGVQVLRAVAALGVLTSHTIHEMATYYRGSVAAEKFVIGTAGVDLFFVISGFVMVYASRTLFGQRGAPRVFFLRRLARIAPLYWGTTAFLIVYHAIRVPDRALLDNPPAAILTSFLFYPWQYPNGPPGEMAPIHGLGWTLNYEMFFYALFAVAIVLPRLAAVAAVSIVLTSLVAIGASFPLAQPFAYWSQPIVLEFCLGMGIALVYQRGFRLSPGFAWTLALVALAMLAASAIKPHDPHNPWRFMEWGLPSAMLVAAVALCTARAKSGPVNRFLAALGDASYSLYLLHPFSIMAVRKVSLWFFDLTQAPWLAAALMFLGAVAFALLAYRYFERPVTRYLQARIRPARDMPTLAEGQRA